MLILAFLCFLVVTLSDSQSFDSQRQDDVGNANAYIDEVLQNFRTDPWILDKVEPLVIPDYLEDNFEVTNGSVTGLSSLYRHGDCSLHYDNNTIKVVAEIAVRDILLYVRYGVKALFFWIRGQVWLTIDDAAVKMVVTMSDGKAKVEEFKVTNLGKYKVKKVTGTSVVLNWLLKLITNLVAKHSKNKIINALENGVASAVNDLFAKYELPNFGQEVV